MWSRFTIDRALRVDLPRLDEPWLRRQFNLKRALLEVELPVEGGGRLVLLDTHLSAFSYQDGTLPRQVDHILGRIDDIEADGAHWILGGDFNSLPPDDTPQRLGIGADLYEEPSPIAPLFERFPSAVPASEHAANPGPWRTYLPWGSNTADRAIDHLFHDPRLEAHGTSVLRDVTDVSDHLPLVFDFQVP